MSILLNNKWTLDTIDDLILNQGLRIKGLYFDVDLDLMLIILTNKKILKRKISDYNRLAKASESDLSNFEIGKAGVYWPILDEDLSLRGFLQEEMISSLGGEKIAS